MVAVPPEEDEDAFVDAPLVPGATATTDIVSAPAPRAANAVRFINPFNPIALPLLVGRPGDGRFAPLRAVSTEVCTSLNNTDRLKIG
jgi:hypothetical protein